MSIVRISKEFKFDAAHALSGYDGKCKNIHGHSYRLLITVKGTPIKDKESPKFGMAIDFKELKRVVTANIIDIFDHSLILKEDALLAQELKKAYQTVQLLPFQPTSENLVEHFVQILQDRLPDNVILYSIKLYETETSHIEWNLDDNLTQLTEK